MTDLGPCVVCGATGYALSCGGPSICPPCDCGIPPKTTKLHKALTDNIALRAAISALAKELEDASRVDLPRQTPSVMLVDAIAHRLRSILDGDG